MNKRQKRGLRAVEDLIAWLDEEGAGPLGVAWADELIGTGVIVLGNYQDLPDIGGPTLEHVVAEVTAHSERFQLITDRMIFVVDGYVIVHARRLGEEVRLRMVLIERKRRMRICPREVYIATDWSGARSGLIELNTSTAAASGDTQRITFWAFQLLWQCLKRFAGMLEGGAGVDTLGGRIERFAERAA